MRRSLALVAAAALVPCLAAARPASRVVVGADVSSLPRVEAEGGAFRPGGAKTGALEALRAAGFTAVRLRVWHTPPDGDCDLAATVAMARRARDLGLRVMLVPHYADSWADPGKQPCPAAWRGRPLATLADSVRTWTRGLVAACAADGAAPDWIQLGNEVDGGMLWDAGRLGAGDAGWDAFATLLRAAAEGSREGAPGVRRVVHFSQGGDAGRCAWFFAKLAERGIPFEVAGVSYYPWWHGPLSGLGANLDSLARRLGRDVMVLETAYPWTLRSFDARHNVVGEPRQVSAWPATPHGQAAFARALRAAVARVPGGRGAGVWWWEPAWIATRGEGSPWENCALFDSAGAALPALRAFGR